jgi:hypothetical protein
MGKIGGLHTKRSIFAGGKSVAGFKTSLSASRSPV